MIKKVTCIIVSAIMATMMCVPALADTGTVTYGDPVSSNGLVEDEKTGECIVTADGSEIKGGSYKVKLPATLKLGFNSTSMMFEGKYNVSAMGTVADNYEVYINPQPFTMKAATSGTVDTGTVTQNIKQWRRTAGTNILALSKTNWADSEGTVEIDLTKNEKYEGKLTFKYGLRSY